MYKMFLLANVDYPTIIHGFVESGDLWCSFIIILLYISYTTDHIIDLLVQ